MGLRGRKDLVEILPHRGDSVLIDHVVDQTDNVATVVVLVGDSPWFCGSGGQVAPWVSIEYMAQAAAANEGIMAVKAQQLPRPGYLVSVKALRLPPAPFDSGDQLWIVSERIGGRPGLGVFSHRCSLYLDDPNCGSEPVAEGRFSVAIAENE